MPKDFPITPIHDKLIIKPVEADRVSEGGIIIPDSVQQRPNKATVVAAGEGLLDRPMKLKVGDIVFHVKQAGTKIEYEKEEYWIISDRDVLCKFKK